MQNQPSWTSRFSGLGALDGETRRYLEDHSVAVSVAKGSIVFGPGKAPEHMLLLLSGIVRVSQVSESGREIVLYRVAGGESCVLTTACLLAHEAYVAEGVAETDAEAIAIPKATFEELMARSDVFRRFVFAGYSERITELFHVINAIAFSRIDIRLAKTLCLLAGDNDAADVTQQQLATELGTAREVVTRQIQEFKRRGWVDPGRGRITLVDRTALERLADAV